MVGIIFSKDINGWTPSQTSSGYFKKFNFINFRMTNEGYVVELRHGLYNNLRNPKIIARAKNYESALSKAKSYMRSH